MSRIILKKQNWFFEGKEDTEDVVLVLHRHWFTLSVRILLVLVYIFLPVVLLVALSSFIVKYNLISIFSFFWVTYYLVLWFWLFYTITMYTLDNWIVTTKRIIDSMQGGFFNRNVAELQLDKIQDVSYRIEGLIPTFFNYGVVEIQTAGKDHKFFFEQVADPQRVKDIIMELVIEEENADVGLNKGQENHVLVEENGVPTPLILQEADDAKEGINDAREDINDAKNDHRKEVSDLNIDQ